LLTKTLGVLRSNLSQDISLYRNYYNFDKVLSDKYLPTNFTQFMKSNTQHLK